MGNTELMNTNGLGKLGVTRMDGRLRNRRSLFRNTLAGTYYTLADKSFHVFLIDWSDSKYFTKFSNLTGPRSTSASTW